jgi:hypothetical protein
MRGWISIAGVSALLFAAACGEEQAMMTADAGPDGGVIDAGFVHGVVENQVDRGHMHVAAPDPIVYLENPPSSGPHRPIWAKWGEYPALPTEYWVHNIEHGGAALLYAETTSSTVVAALRDYARSRPSDGGGAFRYVLTKYNGLPVPFAVVTWLWTYEADEVFPGELDIFLAEHYRGPGTEDVPSDGSYNEGWIER